MEAASLESVHIEIGRIRASLDKLEDAVTNNNREMGCRRILGLVASEWRIELLHLTAHGKDRARCEARQAAMYLACRLTDLSMVHIAQVMGGFHHTTVIYSMRKISDSREKSEQMDTRLRAIEEQFQELSSNSHELHQPIAH